MKKLSLLLLLSILLSLPASAVPVSESGLSLMARAVASECPDADFAVQIALAAVMLNRMEAYGYTPAQTVYGDGFLSCARTGRIALDPDPLVYEQALSAVRYALNGMDPTDGSLWYGGGQTGRSAAGKQVRFGCGGHLFW